MSETGYHVQWTRTAEDDLTEIVRYIAADSPENARAVLERLRTAANSLVHHPLRGRRPPELADLGLAQYREMVRRPWRIVYRVEERRVLVMAVLDGRRELEDQLLDRLVR
ncbi:MAG TPA: type II toxin-antitoxin system RelE/ParE family toxin [Gammaproteobacteria bacterium]|nr:type II toxin-antitoxin system RelE/ParE family toxin [Gammaproteobacteria bacterium]